MGLRNLINTKLCMYYKLKTIRPSTIIRVQWLTAGIRKLFRRYVLVCFLLNSIFHIDIFHIEL